MSTQNTSQLHEFATLHWYDETIKFIFNFVTKTSELLLAAGIVVSTANFLTDGSVMQGHSALSDAWAWAQAIVIGSTRASSLSTPSRPCGRTEKEKRTEN